MLDKIKTFMEKIGNENDRPANQQSLFLEAETNGFVPFNTGMVKIKAYNDVTKSQRLNNISVKWFRKFENRNYTIDNIEESINFSCDDIGSTIIAVVSDNDRPNVFESISFGPITVDPQCRIELESLLKAGRAIFEVQLPYKDIGNDGLRKPPEAKDSNKFIIDEVVITAENVTIVHSRGHNSTLPLKSFKFESVAEYPLLVKAIVPSQFETELDSLEFRIAEESGSWFYIKFFNRIFRENFLMLAKLFTEVKIQPYHAQIAEWENRGAEQNFFAKNISGFLGTNTSGGVADMMLQIERMKDALNRNVTYTKTVQEDREALIQYSEGLERDLKATLKDLKDLVVKQKLQGQFDVSKLERVETSILDVKNWKVLDQISRIDTNPGSQFANLKVQKLQDDNDRLEKLNKMLLKELSAYREKRKEKIRSINQSLNALNNDLAQQAQNLNVVATIPGQHSMDVSKYLDNFDGKSMTKKKLPEILEERNTSEKKSKVERNISDSRVDKSNRSIYQKNPQLELSIMVTEKAEIQQKLSILQRRVYELENELNDLKQSKEVSDPFFERQFYEIRKQINETFSQIGENSIEGKSSNSEIFDRSFGQTLRKMAQTNRAELLNIENAVLSQRISYLLELIRKKNPGSNPEEGIKATLTNLQSRIENLRSENKKLIDEVCRSNKEGNTDDSMLRKQNTIMRTELAKLKADNERLEAKGHDHSDCEEKMQLLALQIDEKEKVLQRAVLTNKALAEELNRLQNYINMNESLNTSSARD